MVDKQTGKPKENVKIEVCGFKSSFYRNEIFQAIPPKTPHIYQTDKDGFAEIPYLVEYDSELHQQKKRNKEPDFLYENDRYYLTFTTPTDFLFTTQSFENVGISSKKDFTRTFSPSNSSQIYTDRSIYRPGQTVYFKGIVYRHEEKADKVLENHTAVVKLHNANRQEVASVTLVTNEYGTYQGSFVLPSTGLTGNFLLFDNVAGSSISFLVEEYKRPKFEVTFDTLKGNFKVGEKIKVTGIAKNYAGNSVQDAKVMYRIVRAASFPYWYDWYWWRPYPSSATQEVAHGEMKTNEEGKFDIEFLAIEDSNLNVKYFPQYSYQVFADVVDLSGETHSAQISPRAGYIDIDIQFDFPKKIDLAEKEMKYPISSVNTNQVFTPARGTLAAYSLEADRGYLHNRAWEMPDEFVLSEDEFKALFSNEPYKNEADVRRRKRVSKVFSIAFNTSTDKEMNLTDALKSLKVGHYVLEIKTQDAFGTPLTKTYFFDIEDIEKNLYASPEILDVNADKTTGREGEKNTITLASTENVWVLVRTIARNPKTYLAMDSVEK